MILRQALRWLHIVFSPRTNWFRNRASFKKSSRKLCAIKRNEISTNMEFKFVLIQKRKVRGLLKAASLDVCAKVRFARGKKLRDWGEREK